MVCAFQLERFNVFIAETEHSSGTTVAGGKIHASELAEVKPASHGLRGYTEPRRHLRGCAEATAVLEFFRRSARHSNGF